MNWKIDEDRYAPLFSTHRVVGGTSWMQRYAQDKKGLAARLACVPKKTVVFKQNRSLRGNEIVSDKGRSLNCGPLART
jgi:hypothetical protein